MCILSHASYISDFLNISIYIFVEHQNICIDALCRPNKCMNEMNEHGPNAVIIDIREDMWKVRFFANGRDIWHASIFWTHLITSRIVL